MQDDSRYSRQTLVKEVGVGGQKLLSTASVLIVGAGGLGCTVAALLAGAGVGEIVIIDNDLIDETNLHRQILYREADIGNAKAEVAARELAAINSKVKISALNQRLSPINVKQLSFEKTLVIDAADNFPTSYLLSDACTELSISLLSASVNRTFGYLSTFCNGAPSMRAVFPKIPQTQANCDTVGVTGPSVGVIASYQAQEAIKILLGEPSLAGKVLYLDLWNYSQQIIDFSNAKEQENVCFEFIDASQLSKQDWVIDVRGADEIGQSPQHFHTDQELGVNSVATADLTVKPCDQEKRIVLACRTGQRAMIAAQLLSEQGYSKIAIVLPS